MSRERELWLARERSVALWMHGAATRAWVVRLLDAVSRVGDGWLWYAIIVCLPMAGGPIGASASVRMIARRRRQPDPLQDHQALDRAAAAVPHLPGHPRLRALARRVQLPERPHAALGRVQPDPDRVLPDVRALRLAVHACWSRSRASSSACTTRATSIVGALIGAVTAAVSFNLL